MELIVVLCGLPACGKTRFTESYNKIIRHYHIEKLKQEKMEERTRSLLIGEQPITEKEAEEEVLEDIQFRIEHQDLRSWNTVVAIEGNLQTQEAYEKIAQLLVSKKLNSVKIEFHWWEEDREACLWNNHLRFGKEYVEKQILESAFEKPDEKRIKAILSKAKVIAHQVIKKDSYHLFKDKYGFKQDSFSSPRWSLGGTRGDYNGDTGTVSADIPLSEFEKFDALIDRLCPEGMSYKLYRKIFKESVSFDTEGESDYYGGHINYGFFKCDLKKLYKLLIEENILEEKDR